MLCNKLVIASREGCEGMFALLDVEALELVLKNLGRNKSQNGPHQH
jgi:hypothetical protein